MKAGSDFVPADEEALPVHSTSGSAEVSFIQKGCRRERCQPASFAITAARETVTLDNEGCAEVSFTASNTGPKSIAVDCVRRVIPQPTERQHIVDQIRDFDARHPFGF